MHGFKCFKCFKIHLTLLRIPCRPHPPVQRLLSFQEWQRLPLHCGGNSCWAHICKEVWNWTQPSFTARRHHHLWAPGGVQEHSISHSLQTGLGWVGETSKVGLAPTKEVSHHRPRGLEPPMATVRTCHLTTNYMAYVLCRFFESFTTLLRIPCRPHPPVQRLLSFQEWQRLPLPFALWWQLLLGPHL